MKRMIISASRRTDLPNYYSEWFFNRIKEGYALVRNPMNFHQVSRISLLPDVVDCIVFWTKNPQPMLRRLDEIKNFPYYFQFTLTPYGRDIEPYIPSKNDVIIPAFQELSRKIGPDKVIWRYDPILVNNTYTIRYHIERFEEIAKKLSGYTKKCTISFIDLYSSIVKYGKDLNLQVIRPQDMRTIASSLSEIASRYGIRMDTCSESVDLSEYSVGRARCIDGGLIEKIAGCKLDVKKDKAQRPECGCAESIDIGAYDTCPNGCRYCYATHHPKLAQDHFHLHDPLSPLLFGALTEGDVVKERSVKSRRICQLSF